jgi:hypothetical protein
MSEDGMTVTTRIGSEGSGTTFYDAPVAPGMDMGRRRGYSMYSAYTTGSAMDLDPEDPRVRAAKRNDGLRRRKGAGGAGMEREISGVSGVTEDEWEKSMGLEREDVNKNKKREKYDAKGRVDRHGHRKAHQKRKDEDTLSIRENVCCKSSSLSSSYLISP